MKRNMLTAVMICFIAAHTFAQGLADKTMTFYGVDFSKAKMVGADGFKDPNDVKTKMTIWNGLFTAEADKYDLYKAFKKDKVTLDMTACEKIMQQ